VQRLHAQARDTFRAVRSMERLVERAWNLLSRTRPDERRIKTLSDRIERESARMAGREELLNLLVEGAFMLELYMSKESVRAIDGIADPVERFRKQIERARVYYGAMKDVLPVLVNGLAALRANLDAHARAERMPEGTTAQRLGKALAFKAIKNYPRARALYRQVLTDEPDNLQALFHTGEILYECHRAEEALACFTRVTTLSPRHRGAAAWIPRCREKAALWEDKTAEAQAVRRADAERDRMAEAAGLYAAVGDCRRATQALREWMRREPGDVEPHLRLAALCRAQEDVAGELRSYEEGLAAHPDHPALLQALGFYSIRLGRPDQAGAFFRAAGRSDPALCEAGADALMQAGAFLEAGDLYETAVRHAPGRFDLIEKSAQAFRRAGRMLAAAGGAR
jgi:tetratricopeptide (TPR) repeat protein